MNGISRSAQALAVFSPCVLGWMGSFCIDVVCGGLEKQPGIRFTLPACHRKSMSCYCRQVQRLGGRGCNIFFPVLGGNGTKIAPTGDIFDQPPGQMR